MLHIEQCRDEELIDFDNKVKEEMVAKTISEQEEEQKIKRRIELFDIALLKTPTKSGKKTTLGAGSVQKPPRLSLGPEVVKKSVVPVRKNTWQKQGTFNELDPKLSSEPKKKTPLIPLNPAKRVTTSKKAQ